MFVFPGSALGSTLTAFDYISRTCHFPGSRVISDLDSVAALRKYIKPTSRGKEGQSQPKLRVKCPLLDISVLRSRNTRQTWSRKMSRGTGMRSRRSCSAAQLPRSSAPVSLWWASYWTWPSLPWASQGWGGAQSCRCVRGTLRVSCGVG